MKALQVTAHGRPGDVLAVRTLERPEPGPGEVQDQGRGGLVELQ